MHDGLVSRRISLGVGDERDECRDVSVRYLAAGDGPPLILLHGIGLDAATVSWRHTVPELAKHHRVYALDLPGHGGSEKPRVRYTTEFYRRTLAAFVDELGVGDHSVAGISMGGSVALGHALAHPDRVEKLGLVASYGLGEDAPWRAQAHTAHRVPFLGQLAYRRLGMSKRAVRQRLARYTAELPEDLVEDVHATVQDPAIGRTATSWQRSECRAGGLTTSYVDRLGDVEPETLVVQGVDDPIVPLEWAETAVEGIPDSRLEVIENCGHWAPRERPEWFNRVFTRFFAGEAATPDAPGVLRAANGRASD